LLLLLLLLLILILILIFIPIFRPTCWYLWLRDEGAPFVPSASLGTNLFLISLHEED
jgi:hypothetical protein